MERVRLLEGVVRNRRIQEEEGEEERKKNKVGCERC